MEYMRRERDLEREKKKIKSINKLREKKIRNNREIFIL
jgi:hypothetical protein